MARPHSTKHNLFSKLILTTALTSLMATPSLADETPKSMQDDNFEIKLINDYNLEYWDLDTKANKYLTALHPKVPAGFYSLGSVAIGSDSNYEYIKDPNMQKPNFPSLKEIPIYTFVVKPLPGKSDLLKKPEKFEQVWNDEGTGGDRDGSFYRAICPNGYAALGGVVSRHYDLSVDDAKTANFRCVKRTLLTKASWKKDPVWNDHGTEDPDDASVWSVTAPQSPKNNQLIMAYNASYVSGEKGFKTPKDTPFAMTFTFSDAPELAGKLSQEKKTELENAQPVFSDAFAVEVTQTPEPVTVPYNNVPFFMVKDDEYDMPTKWAKYPFYRITRSVTWHLLDKRDNTGKSCVNWEEADSYQVGYEKGIEASTTWDNSVGAEVGVTTQTSVKPFGIGAGLEFNASVNYSHNFGGSDATTTSKSETYDVKQIPGTFTAVYQVGSDYQTERLETDGTWTTIKKTDGTGFHRSGRDGDIEVVRYVPNGWTKDNPCLSGAEKSAEVSGSAVRQTATSGDTAYDGILKNEVDYDTVEDVSKSQTDASGNFHLLDAGHTLAGGTKHWSKSGNHYLVFEPQHGNLVVYDKTGDNIIWGMREHIARTGHVAKVIYQHDGNLAAYDANDGYMWSALHTASPKGTELRLTDSGVLQIVHPDGTIAWSSAE